MVQLATKDQRVLANALDVGERGIRGGPAQSSFSATVDADQGLIDRSSR
jgi:hypothetical protein